MGAGVLILNERTRPAYVGRIIKYESLNQMQAILAQKPPVAYSTIPGYLIAVIYGGIVGRGYVLAGSLDMQEQAQRAMEKMAIWYYENKIGNGKGYHRYKID